MNENEPKKILFVCMGNICRSPAGEGLFSAYAEAQSDSTEQLLIDSAGTHSYHVGSAPDRRMRIAADRRGYQLTGRARQVTRHDLDEFDIVIAMDRDNHAALVAMASTPRATIRLLSDFLDGDWPADVPDPYYGGDEGFEEVLDMIEAACPKILDALVSR